LKVQRYKYKTDTLRRADLISSITKRGSILDIGAGYGFFVKEVRRRGFNPVGIEISKFARNFASNKNYSDMSRLEKIKK